MKSDSVFKECFLFLRQHNAGVEDVDKMVAAGFKAIFVNIGDPASPPEAWDLIRARAGMQHIPCGPWLRTQDPDGSFSETRLQKLIDVAHIWHQPYIVNSESELKASGSTLTTLIAQAVGEDDCAISMEPILFDNVSWVPVGHIPMLLQIFPAPGIGPDPAWYIDNAHKYGVECVFPTFASYGGRKPSDYDLKAPYSIYTADDCGQNYVAWSPTSTGYVGCIETPQPGGKVAGVKTEIDKALDYFEKATVPDKWQEQNKGEYNKIKDYNASAPGTPAPTGINSDFGKGLLAVVEAGRWADGTHA